MPEEAIPAVDPAEVEALARAADVARPPTAKTETPVPDLAARADGDAMALPKRPPPERPERPDRGVAAQLALAAEIAAMAERLERMEAQTRHTMLLVMVLADRWRVSAEEYDHALALAKLAETAAGGTT